LTTAALPQAESKNEDERTVMRVKSFLVML
jgi:hypothetical protein